MRITGLASELAGYEVVANHDVVLVSPGGRKALVINEITILTGMSRRAADLVGNAPSLIMRQVTSERANRAKTRLENLGATVTVTSDPAQR